ncbi:hypothetical protein Lpar_3629 [Legionella parisiensis]|uniref:Uncharacterized protein n=1 Tax=Legionella parisiensis TaxID=45071 RepID=A0A1E5JMX2_9GAMM|nr:hypothetical protein Lpar_3629 [Legionella parisiensis]OEH45869.1 hypothetical protein lpari_03188 [Legionella parisiensis]STX72383.1 Uncharacterised protein [Legionella parisiensis]
MVSLNSKIDSSPLLIIMLDSKSGHYEKVAMFFHINKLMYSSSVEIIALFA